jgi:hypothetical protein
MNIEYLKKIELGANQTEGFIVKPIASTLGTYDAFPEFETPFQKLKGEISFPKNISDYGYQDFLDDFDDMLAEKDHIYSEQVIVALTFIFLHIRAKDLTTQAAWSKFQRKFFTSCQLHLEFPTEMVLKEVQPSIKLKNYEIGVFDFESLKTKVVKHTQSDFALRLAKERNFNLQNKKFLSFKRVETKCSILNVIKLLDGKYFPVNQCNALFDVYFEALSVAWFNQFWEELEQQQTVSVALGGIYYDLTWFRDFNVGKGLQIAVYTHIDGENKQGWVIPIDLRLTTLKIDSKSRPEELNVKIQEYYAGLDDTETNFVNLINVLTEFIAQGNRLLFHNKINEAFLNFWIGLDAVLNDDDKLAQSKLLKKRVALLTFSTMGKSYQDQFANIEELYSLRGGLVHAGKPVSRQKSIEICNIAEIVLESLFIAHNKAKANKELSIDLWFKDIDDFSHLLINNAKPEKLSPFFKKFSPV